MTVNEERAERQRMAQIYRQRATNRERQRVMNRVRARYAGKQDQQHQHKTKE